MEIFDAAVEQPISLADAARYIPADNAGKKVNFRTIERWIKHGHRGVFLEGAYIGHRLCTSKEAIARFSVKCSPAGAKPAKALPIEKRKSHQKAKQFLANLGAGSAAKSTS